MLSVLMCAVLHSVAYLLSSQHAQYSGSRDSRSYSLGCTPLRLF
jgi:hypothetical protein